MLSVFYLMLREITCLFQETPAVEKNDNEITDNKEVEETEKEEKEKKKKRSNIFKKQKKEKKEEDVVEDNKVCCSVLYTSRYLNLQ